MRLSLRLGGLLLLCAGLAAGAADAASLPIRFERLSVQEGLSQATVLTVFQDSRGFLWVGTEDGLNRFDGYRFKVYRHDEHDATSLPGDVVWSLAEDAAGHLWVATEGGGVGRWDPATDTFTRFRPEPARPDSIASNAARAIAVDEAGAVWIGYLDAGVDRFDPATGRVRHLRALPDSGSGLPSDAVYALALDKGGLFVGTEAGVVRLDRATLVTATLPVETPKVRALHLLGDGRLAIGTSQSGLTLVDPASGAARQFRHDDSPASIAADTVRAILHTADGRIWVGTSSGLDRFDGGTGRFDHYRHDRGVPTSIGDDYVMALFQDRGGVVWAGTRSAGLAKWDPATWRFGYTTVTPDGQGLSVPQVTAFALDRLGALWVGTFGGGLNRFDPATGEVRHLRADGTPGALPDDRVMSLLADRRGRLWVGTYTSGVARLDPGAAGFVQFAHVAADERTPSADGIMTLHEDAGGVIWVGTFGGGLNRYEEATGRFVRYPTSVVGGRVTAIVDNPGGGVWVATDGAGLFELQNGQVRPFRHDKDAVGSLPTDALLALHLDGTGQLWIGTRGGGLLRLDTSDVARGFIRYGTAEGLANNVVYGIEPDDDAGLWVSTNNGLYRLDLRVGRFTGYGPEHGLQGADFNIGAHYRDRQGRLYFGGSDGFNAFLPSDIKPRGFVPPIVLTSFSRLNTQVPLAATARMAPLDVGYRDSMITFEFSALDFSAPRRNQYRHRLEGFDDAWIDLGAERRVTYTNLDPGTYTLRVQAAGADGVWTESGLSVPIVVEAPPWRRWYAYVLYGLVLCGILAVLERARRVRRQRDEDYRRQLEREVAERTRELAERAEELQRVNGQLAETSVADSLTGLRNRRFLFEAVGPTLSASATVLAERRRHGEPAEDATAVLLLVDLDYFKQINDTHGHMVGDEVLVEVAARLRTVIRADDTLIRWGGDELLVITRDTSPEAGAGMAERIRAAVGGAPLVTSTGLTIPLSCTVGFACYPFLPTAPDAGKWEDVLGLADLALYAAKRESRNNWAGCVATAKADPDVFRQLHTATATLESERLVEFRRPQRRPAA